MNTMRTICAVMFLAFSVVPCMAADNASFALLTQAEPSGAGQVLPGEDVQRVQVGQTVSLTAVPKTGFRFLYWVGDVAQAGHSQTTVRMNGPKMVVAVFGKEEFGSLPDIGIVSGSGGSNVYANPNVYSANSVSLYSSTGTATTDTSTINTSSITDDDDDSGIVVPGDDDDNSGEVVPEPATLLLLGLGAYAARRMRNKQ